MTRRIHRISLVAGTALVALAAWGPAALAEPKVPASTEPSVAVAPDWFERAAQNALREGRAGYLDAAQRARMAPIRSGAPAGHVDRYELDLPTGPVAASPTGDGRELEWPQLGIGFGLGILLAFGLVLAARLTRFRPLTH
ncbi:MAG TPA: hypothetical protein VNK94_11450 [Gaiellaceae bacterium]|nr:hypothetical protein [Gaiellaceae bacterium]